MRKKYPGCSLNRFRSSIYLSDDREYLLIEPNVFKQMCYFLFLAMEIDSSINSIPGVINIIKFFKSKIIDGNYAEPSIEEYSSVILQLSNIFRNRCLLNNSISDHLMVSFCALSEISNNFKIFSKNIYENNI